MKPVALSLFLLFFRFLAGFATPAPVLLDKYNECPFVDFGPDTLLCSGASITLNAENPGATYLWNDGSTGAQLPVYFGGEYWVKVTRDGCTVSDTININYGSLLYAEFDYEQTGTCMPVIAAFSEYSEACSGSVVEWTWDFGDGSTSTERNPVHTYSAPGDYTVSLKIKNNTGAIYLTNNTITIEGELSPVVDLGEDITICESDGLVLSAGNPGAVYQWSTGETTQSISVPESGNFSVVVEKDGCIGRDSVDIIITPSLAADFSYEKDPGCLPVNIQFTDNSVFCEDGLISWLWEFGDGSVSTLQHPEHTFTEPGEFEVWLTITHTSGEIAKSNKTITVEPNSLAVDLGTDTTICSGGSLILDSGIPGATYLWSTGETTQQIVTGTGGDYNVQVSIGGCNINDTVKVAVSPAVHVQWHYNIDGECLPVTAAFADSSEVSCEQTITGWNWEFGDGNTSVLQHPVHTYLTADSFVVKLTVTLSGGGFATSIKKIGISNTIPETILPSALTVCRGESFQLTAGAWGEEYRWYPGFGLNDTTIRNPVITPVINSLYVVRITGCSAMVMDSVYITIDNSSRPVVTQEGNSLHASAAAGYQWYREGNLISGATGNIFRPEGRGLYAVKVFNSNGCHSESAPFHYIPVNSEDSPAGGIRISCSPNPARERINILLSDIPEKAAKVTVYNRYGKAVVITTIQNQVNTLNVHKLAAGIYFVEVIINNDRKVIPVVVQ